MPWSNFSFRVFFDECVFDKAPTCILRLQWTACVRVCVCLKSPPWDQPKIRGPVLCSNRLPPRAHAGVYPLGCTTSPVCSLPSFPFSGIRLTGKAGAGWLVLMTIFCLVCCLRCMFFIFSPVCKVLIHKNRRRACLSLLLSLSFFQGLPFLFPKSLGTKSWLLEWEDWQNTHKKEKIPEKISFITLWQHLFLAEDHFRHINWKLSQGLNY